MYDEYFWAVLATSSLIVISLFYFALRPTERSSSKILAPSNKKIQEIRSRSSFQ